MRIDYGNLEARVTGYTPDERSFLVDYLTFHQQRYSKHHAPAPLRMFNILRDTFPSGYVTMVAKVAAEEGFTVDLQDARHRDPAWMQHTAAADISWLRDYQRAAYDRVLERTRGILWMPTGSGKTEVACALAHSIDCRWLFLVNRKSLLGQAADRYELRTGDSSGRVGDGRWEEERFTVASFQTISAAVKRGDRAALDLLESAEGIIVDEVHVLPADSHMRVVKATPNAYWRVGMSGTPLAREDRRSVLAVATTGPVIYRIKPEVLVEAGVLAKPDITMVEVVQSSDCPTWQGVYGACVVRSASRNTVLTKVAQLAEKPCLMFVKEVAHGKQLLKRLGKAGVKAEFAWGQLSEQRRNTLVDALERADLDVLICSVIFQEGKDIPSLRSIVIGSGGKSAIAALQRIGRGMRTDRGTKFSFEVYDIADKGNVWLERHTKRRIKAYEGEGFAVKMTQA